jgi:hypothetical protein
MPRYHFKLIGQSESFEDPEGVELDNIADAREEAISCARDLMRSPAKRYGGDWAAWSVCVLDEAGSEVYALRLTDVVAAS